ASYCFDISGVKLDLLDQFAGIPCALDAVDRTPVDRGRLMPQTVVGDLEQGVDRQSPEQLRVGVDPARIDEKGGRYPFLRQEFHQPGIDALAPGTAAGIQ